MRRELSDRRCDGAFALDEHTYQCDCAQQQGGAGGFGHGGGNGNVTGVERDCASEGKNTPIHGNPGNERVARRGNEGARD